MLATFLKDQGFYVLDIKEERGINIDLSNITTALTKVTVKDKAIFSRQFAALVNAGVALVRSLGILAEDCSNPKLKEALMGISADVQQGTSLSDAMRKHPASFDNLYVALVQAGEVGGVFRRGFKPTGQSCWKT